MDKRILSNMEVKQKIRTALFRLLQEKQLNEISVSELIQKAGVARSSFYRNYHTIFEVMVSRIDDVAATFAATNPINTVDFTSTVYLTYMFSYFHKVREDMLSVFRAGYSSLILQSLTDYHLDVLGNMVFSSIDRYDIYYYSGALFNVIVQWIESGEKETPEEMAIKFKSLVENDKSSKIP